MYADECIDVSLVCDGCYDCVDGSDERFCPDSGYYSGYYSGMSGNSGYYSGGYASGSTAAP